MYVVYVKDFCVARFLHIGTIEGTTLAKINLEWIPNVSVQSRTFISGINTYKTEMADFIHIKRGNKV